MKRCDKSSADPKGKFEALTRLDLSGLMRFRIVSNAGKKKKLSPLLSRMEIISILREGKASGVIEIWENDRPISCKKTLALVRAATR